jgi:hypothetical protein
LEAQTTNAQIIGSIIQKENAQTVYRLLNEGQSDFEYSRGWGERKGKLYGTKHGNICEEQLSVESESHLKITKKLKLVVMNEEI